MGKKLEKLIETVAVLRGPNGCPWDREQTHRSLLPCLLDETYEFFDAVDENDPEKMKEELGDLLLQIALHAQMADESKQFTLEDVAGAITEKLIRRHPHVFGDAHVSGSTEVIHRWEEIKRAEKRDRKYITDGIPRTLPALFAAEKLQRKVAKVGFDWQYIDGAIDKVEEEFEEFKHELKAGNCDEAEEELGDIMFALVNVARHAHISSEQALRKAVKKFEKRFRYIEDKCRNTGEILSDLSLEQLDSYWEEGKRKERENR
jgi:tetrapyrrole methylase family protein/MazG family protein